MSKTISAGLIMYRLKNGQPEILLVHPGGPFFKNKDDGSWSIPKGETDDGETDLLEVAKREFREEAGIEPVGEFKSVGTVERPGKILHIWAFEGDCDPAKIESNTCEVEWPPRSGKKMVIPEIDRGNFFSLEAAAAKLSKWQVPLIELFKKAL